MKNAESQNLADKLAAMLSGSAAWVHMDAETNRPVVYLNDGDKRYCVKKVQVFNEESGKLTTKWVNLGEAPQKEAPAATDPAVVQALKELIAEGKQLSA